MTYREKLLSINFAKKVEKKTSVNVYDTHTVEVTERDDRQDVTVRLGKT